MTSHSYIQFLLNELTGINVPPGILDIIVMIVFIGSFVAGILLTISDIRKRKAASVGRQIK